MAPAPRGAWAFAAGLVVLGALLILLDPGAGFLGLAMGLVGGLLLVGQTLASANEDVPAERRLPKRKVPVLLALSLGGMLVVVGLFTVVVTNSAASQCLLGRLALGAPSFETSTSPDTHLAVLPVQESPCPAPSTQQLRILLSLSGSYNASAPCGPGTPSVESCPSVDGGWYVLLAGPTGEVVDGYPSQTGGESWIGGSASIASGDSFDLVTAANLTGTSVPFTVEVNLNGCDTPWCSTGGTQV